MRKLFCDMCKKETEGSNIVTVKLEHTNTHMSGDWELCWDCAEILKKFFTFK